MGQIPKGPPQKDADDAEMELAISSPAADIHQQLLKKQGPSRKQQENEYPQKAFFVDCIPFLAPFRMASKRECFLALLGVAAAIFGGLALPYATMTMGKSLNDLNREMNVNPTAKTMAISGLVAFFLTGSSAFCLELVASRVVARVRRVYARAALSQSMAFFDTNKNVGALAADLEAHSVTLRNGMGMKLSLVLSRTAVVLGCLGVAIYTKWDIALMSMAGMVLCCCWGGLVGLAAGRVEKKTAVHLTRGSALADEAVLNIRTVVAFGGEESVFRRYAAAIRDAAETARKGGLFSAVAMGGLMGSVVLLVTLAMYLSGNAAADSLQDLMAITPPSAFTGPLNEWPVPEFQGGDAYTLSLCLLLASFGLDSLSESLVQYSRSISAARVLYETCRLQSGINPMSTDGVRDVPLDGEIHFDSVSFSYPSRLKTPVLKDFSLTIPAGKTVAFVGASGSGKSTLLQLLQRAYDPDKGTVSIGGR